MLFFFFFKQKTAYEMRISDWSSDVCSSDLDDDRHAHRGARGAGWARRPRVPEDGQHVPRRLGMGRQHAVPGNEAARLPPRRHPQPDGEIGRASCRERVCQYVWISVGAGKLKKTKTKIKRRRTDSNTQ